MKILVTGGTGHIGSQVITELVNTRRERPRFGSQTGGVNNTAERSRGLPGRSARPGRGRQSTRWSREALFC